MLSNIIKQIQQERDQDKKVSKQVGTNQKHQLTNIPGHRKITSNAIFSFRPVEKAPAPAPEPAASAPVAPVPKGMSRAAMRKKQKEEEQARQRADAKAKANANAPAPEPIEINNELSQ